MHATGREVVVLDDLSNGRADRLPAGIPVEIGSLLDADVVSGVLKRYRISAVVHIAAKKQVGESVQQPLYYFEENVGGLVSLLTACRDCDVARLVFSSSAAVYGLPEDPVVAEDAELAPLSPYGETKLVGEWLLRDSARAFGMRSIALRYFNVAGAGSDDLGDVGAFNLIPVVLQRLQAGQRPQVFGRDYPTPDGTCVRDFVHVADVARAHVAAVEALEAGHRGATYNVGRGTGASVMEVLAVVHEVTGLGIDPEFVDRRPGDPARVVAAVDRIRAELGFTARYDLRDMVDSAWRAR